MNPPDPVSLAPFSNFNNIHSTQFMLDLEDGNGQPRTLQSFIENEANYDFGFFEAWKIFVTNKDKPLQTPNDLLNLLDNIQKCALSHLPETREIGRDFQHIQGREWACVKCTFNFFGITKDYCSNEQGIKDLICKIWVKGDDLHLKTNTQTKDKYYILNNKQFFLVKDGNEENAEVIFKRDIELVQQTVKNIFSTLNPFYQQGLCERGCDRMVVFNRMRADVREKKALEIFGYYLREIKKVESNKAKKGIISETMRDLLQLHMYWDANGRSLYILANLLLHQIGQPLFYPKNICLFDANSVGTMISEIKMGQKRFKQMFGDEEKLTHGLRSYIGALRQLGEIIKNNFSNQNIIKSFDERSFNLLLRQSAANKTYIKLLEYLLNHGNDLGIDINSKGEKSGTALDVAKKFNNEEAVKLLNAATANTPR